MRPVDFSDEKIIEAGERLKEISGKVTGYGLRNELGGGTQKRLLSVWKKYAEQESAQVLPETELPLEIEELLSSTGQTLLSNLRSTTASINLSATKIADRQVAEVSRQLKELEEQTDAELNDAEVIIKKLESEAENLRKKLTTAQDDLEFVREEAKKHEREAFKLETRLKEMTGVEELIKRLEALEERAGTENSGDPEVQTAPKNADKNHNSRSAT
jgi:chromosome segregation ATPase